MNKITMYKPNDRKITFNDLDGAAEAMLKDGWRLEPFNAKKEVQEPDKKEPVETEEMETIVETSPTLATPSRRSRRKSV